MSDLLFVFVHQMTKAHLDCLRAAYKAEFGNELKKVSEEQLFEIFNIEDKLPDSVDLTIEQNRAMQYYFLVIAEQEGLDSYQQKLAAFIKELEINGWTAKEYARFKKISCPEQDKAIEEMKSQAASLNFDDEDDFEFLFETEDEDETKDEDEKQDE